MYLFFIILPECYNLFSKGDCLETDPRESLSPALIHCISCLRISIPNCESLIISKSVPNQTESAENIRWNRAHGWNALGAGHVPGSGLVHLLFLHLERTQVNWQGKTRVCMLLLYVPQWDGDMTGNLCQLHSFYIICIKVSYVGVKAVCVLTVYWSGFKSCGLKWLDATTLSPLVLVTALSQKACEFPCTNTKQKRCLYQLLLLFLPSLVPCFILHWKSREGQYGSNTSLWFLTSLTENTSQIH